MNGFLKQSTASQVRAIGPFLDDTDFKTLETALTIANTDVKVKKNGGTAASKNSGGATADSTTGLYHLTWDATDTNTVGELFYSVKVAGALAVFSSYVVLEEAVYDALFGASAAGYVTDQAVNVTKFGGTTVTARDIGASVLLSPGTGTGQINLSSGAVPVTGDLSTTMKASVNTECDTALADVGVTTTVTGRIDATVSTRASQTSVDTIVSAVDTEVAAIKAKTDQLVFTVANHVDATASVSLSAGDLNSIADAILKRDMSAISGEASRSLLNAIRFLRNKWNLSSGTLTVTKEDDSTSAWTAAVTTDAAAEPVTGSDPT
jgi:hypothetical protein